MDYRKDLRTIGASWVNARRKEVGSRHSALSSQPSAVRSQGSALNLGLQYSAFSFPAEERISRGGSRSRDAGCNSTALLRPIRLRADCSCRLSECVPKRELFTLS